MEDCYVSVLGHDRAVLVKHLAVGQARWDVVVKGILSFLVWSLD